MIQIEKFSIADKTSLYRATLEQLKSLLAESDDLIASLANCTALLKLNFESFSWVGFYLTKGERLVLGPFQGKPACVVLYFGKGVCGSAAAARRTLVVDDVEKFPGHIACDPLSRSEIVVPILLNGEVVAVLDVDSERLRNFDEVDQEYLEKVADLLVPKFQEHQRSSVERTR